MRHQGRIVKWYDAKGFGFVLQSSSDKEVFIHISSFSEFGRRPKIDELVSYNLSIDKTGRLQATEATYVINSNSQIVDSGNSSLNPFFILFFVLAISGKLSWLIPILFIGANLFAFLCYYNDKASAVKNKWRTKESTLHLFSLFGGWGGAYMAQRMFRHKYKKDAFMWTYSITVFINCVVITLLAFPNLSAFFIEKLNY